MQYASHDRTSPVSASMRSFVHTLSGTVSGSTTSRPDGVVASVAMAAVVVGAGVVRVASVVGVVVSTAVKVGAGSVVAGSVSAVAGSAMVAVTIVVPESSPPPSTTNAATATPTTARAPTTSSELRLRRGGVAGEPPPTDDGGRSGGDDDVGICIVGAEPTTGGGRSEPGSPAADSINGGEACSTMRPQLPQNREPSSIAEPHAQHTRPLISSSRRMADGRRLPRRQSSLDRTGTRECGH